LDLLAKLTTGSVREAVASPEAFAVFKRDPRYTVCIYTYASKYLCMYEQRARGRVART
jgi:hypothetical protein